MSKIIGGVGKALGITADPNAGAGQARASQAAIQQAVDEIRNLDLPDIEKEQLLLELQSSAGFLEAEQLGPSAMEAIQLDPRTQQAQMQALQGLQERAEMGMTPEDMALMDRLQDQEARRSQAEQAAILQGMAERGTMDSGMQLAAQLSAQQGAADRGQDRAMDMAGQNFAARQQAIANLGNMGTSMRAQDFNQQSQVAGSKDLMAQFNANNRSDANRTNLGIRQADVGTRNQEQTYNKSLIDRDFQRRRQQAGDVANALTGQAQNLQQQANAAAQAEQNRASGMMDMVTTGATLAMSDSGKKKE